MARADGPAPFRIPDSFPMPSGSWKRIATAAGLLPAQRSSNSLTSLRGLIYMFSGENVPRIPVDNDLFAFDPAKGAWSKVDAAGTPPAARVGHAAAAALGRYLYIFGGRTGVSQELLSMNDLWQFDAETREWSEVKAAGNPPPVRSYHAMASIGSRVFVFAGSGAGGRLNDLYAYNIETKSWEEHAAPNGPSIRGGPLMCSVGGRLLVFGGFCGKELGDLFLYDPSTRSWSQPATSGETPYPRSVTAAVPLRDRYVFVFGGEADPSAKGHEGAGKYHGDAYMLDTADFRWYRVQTGGPNDLPSRDGPSARAWIDAAAVGDSAYVFGGFDGEARLNDFFAWTLRD
eukprot:tig00020934_g16113.t1